MLEKIAEILSKYTNENITEESMLISDLGLTSFDLVSIIMEFEDKFNIEIADREIHKFILVKDIVNYIENH